jgi:hypothetical protein
MLRARLTYANLVATFALFLALGGTAYAVDEWTGANIKDETLTGADIQGKAATSGSPAVPGTLTGADIKDGSVTSYDIAANTIGGGRIIDNSLTGADILESSLGKVGDADTLDGLDSTQLQPYSNVQQGGNYSDVCTVAGAWSECAATTVAVPANKTYRVAIDSAGSFNAGVAANRVQICTSVRDSATAFDATATTPAGCPNAPTGITLGANEIKGDATNGVQTLAGGASGASYVVSTAVRPDNRLSFDPGFDRAVVHTLVTVDEVSGASAAAARRTRAPTLTRGR